MRRDSRDLRRIERSRSAAKHGSESPGGEGPLVEDPDDATNPEPDAELLTAYVDGVAELALDERHQIEARLARDPGVRADQAAVRTLLDRLRALPPEGTEPDWTAMERSIQKAVGRELPGPWWRSWKWLVPAMTLATAAAVLLGLWTRRPEISGPVSRTGPDRISHDARPTEDLVALWLDGAEVEVDLSASDMLGDGEPGDPGDDDPARPDADLDTEDGLLPSTNLAWVDQLDADALDRAELWLARKKG